MNKKCKCLSADMGYHRDDCLFYDNHGKEKSAKIPSLEHSVSILNEIQSQNRSKRANIDSKFEVYFLDYSQKLGDIPLDEEKIKALKIINDKFKQLIKETQV